MGVIQFKVERPDLLQSASSQSLVDFLMYDGRVIPARTTLNGNILRCERMQSESGQLRLLWPRFDGSVLVLEISFMHGAGPGYCRPRHLTI
jgi:hypothetical protein